MNENKDVDIDGIVMEFDHSFWKEDTEDRVKLLESNIVNCCLKITMTNLCKIGPKMRVMFQRT